MTDLDEAAKVLATGSRTEALAFLEGLSGQERKSLGPTFRRWVTDGNPRRIPQARVSLAVAATAAGARQATLLVWYGWTHTDQDMQDAVRLLAARSPAWLPAFVEALLDEEGWLSWRYARLVVRRGLVPPPTNPEYFRGTVDGVPGVGNRRPLVEQLAEDPELIGDHLLAMLVTEGAGRRLALHDLGCEAVDDQSPAEPFPPGTWRVALSTLAQDARLDRGRLLDAVLTAPLHDWANADLGWYVGMHDALGPTPDEVVARQSTYVRLLTVGHGPTIRLAQRQLGRVLGHAGLDPIPFVDASAATLGRPDKTSVSAQLRLLAKLAKAHPDVPMADTVRIAAEHPRSEVRQQAAKLLAGLGEDARVGEPTLAFVAPPVEAWPSARLVEPVTSPGELAELLLALMEDSDPIEMERALDGLLRFADDRPGTADLLLRRADQETFVFNDLRGAAAVLVQAWLTPRPRFFDTRWSIVLGRSTFLDRPALPETLIGALGRRLTGIVRAVRTGGRPSLALPTSVDGAIKGDTLSARLAVHENGPHRETSDLELTVALLRVQPEDRLAVRIPPSLRGSRLVDRVLSTAKPTWQHRVAVRRKTTMEPGLHLTTFADPSAREGDGLDGILARRHPEKTAIREQEDNEYTPDLDQTLALAALLLPHDPGVLAAHAHPYLHRDLRKDRGVCIPIMDALARARVANGAPESSALVLGLAAKDARARTAAQDALLDLARHGVLDGTNLGDQAAHLLHANLIVGRRVCSGLAEVARGSDAAALPVLAALQAMLPVLPGRKDAAPFVELAADLAERTGRPVRLPEELHLLASGTSTSVLARSTRRLLSASGGPG